MIYDYLVIGSGAAGLTSALVLARKGFRVAIVEKAPRPAPLLRGFARKGISFDTGFHYSGCMGDGEILDTLFRYLGLSEKLEKKPLDADGFDIVRAGDTGAEFRFPWGGERVRESLRARYPEEKAAIDQYLDTVFDVCDSTPYLNLELTREGRPEPAAVHSASLKTYLDRLSGNAELKGLLSLHCLLYGVAPDEVPVSHHALIVAPYYRSAHGIRGGGRSVARAFTEALSAQGVDIYCGQGVEDLLFDPDATLKGVRLANGDILNCAGCISTVHPSLFLEMLPERLLRPTFRKRLSRLEDSASAFILYGGCHEPLDFLAGNNMFFVPDPARADDLNTGTLEERPLYLTAAWQVKDPGRNTGFVAICPATYDEVSQWGDSSFGERPAAYRQFKDAIIERLGRHLQTVCPELGGKIAWLEGATPLTVRDYVHAPSGSLYGAGRRVGHYELPTRTRFRNLYLAGQAVTAPGLLGAMMSGILACGHILGHDQLLEDLRRCK